MELLLPPACEVRRGLDFQFVCLSTEEGGGGVPQSLVLGPFPGERGTPVSSPRSLPRGRGIIQSLIPGPFLRGTPICGPRSLPSRSERREYPGHDLGTPSEERLRRGRYASLSFPQEDILVCDIFKSATLLSLTRKWSGHSKQWFYKMDNWVLYGRNTGGPITIRVSKFPNSCCGCVTHVFYRLCSREIRGAVWQGLSLCGR